jgi:hypothetical protein
MNNASKTCFVIIGYGPKPDYATGRIIDLDKTYEYIIKPAFEELGFLCFRACDLTHSGTIDIPMFDSILKSDFVVADISTLNPNVLYELGVRHAVRKNTTIIIAENELSYPFDLSHILIEPYEHYGKGIDHGEVKRFTKLLQEKTKALLADPKTDSPLYTVFPELEVPRFSEKEVEAIKENIKEDGSLSDLMTAAESAKNEKNYEKAFALLKGAAALKQDNIFVTQRLALVTYKSELPTKKEALFNAVEILKPLNPQITTDVETLGLSGAIYKRLFEIDGDIKYLDDALWFYEKGFYIANDYYNGINFALLLNQKATLETNPIDALGYYGSAKRIREKVKHICLMHVESNSWQSRDDQIWILLTLAEASLGLDDYIEEEHYLALARELPDSAFALASYEEQKAKLLNNVSALKEKYREALALLK